MLAPEIESCDNHSSCEDLPDALIIELRKEVALARVAALIWPP